MDFEAEALDHVQDILDYICGDTKIFVVDLQSRCEEVASVLGEHHWLPALHHFAMHWYCSEQHDKHTAFAHGLQFLDWFQASGLSAPGYVLRRVFLLGSRCFQHARLQGKKAADPSAWLLLVSRLAQASLSVTDQECWDSDSKMLGLIDNMRNAIRSQDGCLSKTLMHLYSEAVRARQDGRVDSMTAASSSSKRVCLESSRVGNLTSGECQVTTGLDNSWLDSLPSEGSAEPALASSSWLCSLPSG